MSEQIKVHDVVQIDPSVDHYGGCFAVVSEVKENGRLVAYVQSAGVERQSFVFLQPDHYALCGVAVWVVEGEKE